MVYITSDLFGPSTTHEWQQDRPPNYWHTMSHEQPPAAAAAASLGKRKRPANDDTPHIRETTRPHVSGSSSSSSRTPPPFDPNNDTNNLPYAVAPSRHHDCPSDRRPVKQLKRLSPPKAALVKSTSHLMDVDIDAPPVCDSRAVSDLRSCHACNKAPKRKKDLENYLDCTRCQGRTCFICARQCVACDKATCKKCIVEVGEDGDAWCLDCYSRSINS
ncbi:uncharacterized protein SETTUDRAFT_106128 [Exserohilum turcica Et28A]|uniref:Uncharacterized protein n=1 Tax=Exserohilum turcicum (strain 28A) TaxID=671987 RepID=R0K793_EXST2|nr:uncharacterized protein SETTUDRAFT_106128 [Exserohilum turcica Et28A]EOA88868.1 hypothetical protein SETTUDRAFT_106128 [Exserohilum turcica Et28A]